MSVADPFYIYGRSQASGFRADAEKLRKSRHILNLQSVRFMKKSFLLVLFAVILGNQTSFAVVDMSKAPVSTFGQNPEVAALPADMMQMGLEQFLSLTPASYREATGERLGLKKTIALKAAQKAVKRELRSHEAAGDGITSGVYVLLAILGLGWLAMGIKSDWEGSDWLVNLLLTALCWLPGLIHALVKKKDYF